MAEITESSTTPIPHVGVRNLANALTVARLVMVPLFVALLLSARGEHDGWRLAAKNSRVERRLLSRLFYSTSPDRRAIRMTDRSNGCAFEQHSVRIKSVSRETNFFSAPIRSFSLDLEPMETVVPMSRRHFVQLSACRHFAYRSVDILRNCRRVDILRNCRRVDIAIRMTRTLRKLICAHTHRVPQSRNSSDQPRAVSSCHKRASGIPTTLK